MRKRNIIASIAAVPVAVALSFGGIALASSTPAPTPNKLCYNAGGNLVAAHNTCPAKYKTFTGTIGPKGATGAKGATGSRGAQGASIGTALIPSANVHVCDGQGGVQIISGIPADGNPDVCNGMPGRVGATGEQGPSGLQATATGSLTATTIPTGGSFSSKSVEVGTIDLPSAGEYWVSVNAQVEPNSNTVTGVNAQFFVYNQVKNPSFAGDEFNVGTDVAPFLSTNSSQHDTYANGVQEVTVTGPTTLHIYGFGYDNDGGASSVTLIGGTVNAVELTPAS
jgi:hypothetical protein